MSNAKAATNVLKDEKLEIGSLGPRLVWGGLLVAVLGLGATAWLAQTGDTRQALHSYLLAVVYFIAIGLGALFFVMLQHLTRAGWSVVIRRIAELLSLSLPVLGLFLIPILINVAGQSGSVYSWSNPEVMQKHHLLAGKSGYLNVSFFLIRVVLYFAAWTFFSRFFFSRSLKQDQTGDLKHSYTMQWVAAPGIACFVLSLTFFAIDFVMSLEPEFFSTIFGIYYFAGCALSFFATTILIARFLQCNGLLSKVITTEHYHDLGKFTFGFVFFWSYVAFSQYMLLWYGNIPEETVWLMVRQSEGWTAFSLFLLLGHFALPFAGMLSRHVKRNSIALPCWAIFLLGMEWVDLYWLIMPSASEKGPPLVLTDFTAWLGMAGVFVAHFGWVAQNRKLLPVQDPRIDESLAFENV